MGGLTAIALYRYRFRGKQAVGGMLFIVMMSPDIVMAVSLLALIHGCRSFAWFLVIIIGARNILFTLCYSDDFLAFKWL